MAPDHWVTPPGQFPDRVSDFPGIAARRSGTMVASNFPALMHSFPRPAIDTATPGLLLPYASDPASTSRVSLRRRPRFTIFPLAFLRTQSLLAETPSWGFFSGTAKIAPLGETRRIGLLEDFSYTDPHGRTWLAPAASVVDETPLPPAFQSIIGRVSSDRCRRAAIIHGIACDQQTAAWPDVHLAFYFALRCSGVPEISAKTIYYAVYHFGPRWGVVTGVAELLSALGLGHENTRPLVDQKAAADIAAWIAKTNPSLADLQVTKPTATKIKFAR